jgi:uncharacterized secreted protein with C-terminal beta-propeller domain
MLVLFTTVFFVLIVPFYMRHNTLGQTYYHSSSPQLRRFSSYEELKSFVKANRRISPEPFTFRPTFGPTLSPDIHSGSSVTRTYILPEHSTTNVQVEGVDEADIVKSDGDFIYVLSKEKIVILKAYPPEEAEIFSYIQLNGTLKGTFVNGDKLVIFEERALRTFVKVYDISDRRHPLLTRNISLEGRYFNSRMIGDYVYVLIDKSARLHNGEVLLPKIYFINEVEEISASKIYYVDTPDYSYTFTTVIAIDIRSDEEPSHETFLVGTTRVIYVSLNNIYITFREFERTLIYRIQIDGNKIYPAASGEVSGYVLNQFSMDEYEGYFRIATTTGYIVGSLEQSSSQNHVYILNMNLDIVGRLEGLAPGEKIYSARFMGDRCYLVTFKKVDPLFVIDLKEPERPVVLGELKITGYSDYLHPYDKNHIIGVGKETVAAEKGNFAWYQGVKISLFDVSNVEEPREIAKYEIGDRGTDSPVLRDHKAFLFDGSKNLLVIPIQVAEIDKEKYPDNPPPYIKGEPVWQGAYVFDISLDKGIVLKGKITHIESEIDVLNNSYHVKRSLYIDNILYTISDKKIKMNSLDNLDEINEVEFPL